MSWSASFLDALASRASTPIFVVERIASWQEPGTAWSAVNRDAEGVVDVSFVGARVSPVDWSSQIGGFTVDLVGEAVVRGAIRSIARGSVLRVTLGFAGLPQAEWQAVGCGKVRDWTASAEGAWALRITCDDLISSMQARMDTTAAQAGLFSDLPAATTLSGSYGTSDVTVNVASAGIFGSLTSGAIRIVPSSGTPFYLRYTARSGTALTVTAADYLGSTRVAASSGDQVYLCAWLSGHPLDVFTRILVSRDGTNGSHDVYPTRWGLGVLASLLDLDDIGRYRDTVWIAASGSYEWEWVEDVVVDNALTWLQGLLQRAGGFLTMRQGRVTMRAAANPYTYRRLGAAMLLGAGKRISASWRLSGFHGGQPQEYIVARVTSESSFTDRPSSSSDAATLPAVRRRDYDLEALLRSNETDSRARDADRLYPFATRIPERLEADFTLEAAQLAPGDHVYVETAGLPTRKQIAGGDGWEWGYVDEVVPDYRGGTVRVGMLLYPQGEEPLT